MVLLGMLTALAQTCPLLEPLLEDAEELTVGFFLADAAASLGEAEEVFGCREVSADELARYWVARGALWYLSENDGAQRAFGVSKGLSPVRGPDGFSDDVRALWEAAEPSPMRPAQLRLRGLQLRDEVLVDGALAADYAASEGLHLLQLRRRGEVVVAKVMDVPEGGADVYFDERPPLAGPLRMTGGAVRLSTGERVQVRAALAPRVYGTVEGRDAWASYRRTSRARWIPIVPAAAGLYAASLMTWELQNGGANLPKPVTLGTLAGSSTLMASALVWEVLVLRGRSKARRRLVDVANAQN